jgi:hypothetical protein
MVTQSSDELMELKKADLVDMAKENDLSVIGSKAELVKRIIGLTFADDLVPEQEEEVIDDDLVPEQEEEVEPENTIDLQIEPVAVGRINEPTDEE